METPEAPSPSGTGAVRGGPDWPTVVVPVHNAREVLAGCLDAVHRHTPDGVEVLLIDDASDDPEVAPLLAGWVKRAGPSWRLERQPTNRGFVATANRGMALTSGDIVLLNSDTRVTEGWLDALRRCLSSDPTIATATPWTNNGEIASLPEFCANNPIPPDPDEIARVIRACGTPEYPDIPTAVGFCMAIRRAAIAAIGTFDESRFGLGYGEENDFSMRALQAGWRNVLCDDAYVVHLGGRSFGPRGLAPDDDAMRRVLQRYPDYMDRVGAFIRDDPLAPRRRAVVAALRDRSVALGLESKADDSAGTEPDGAETSVTDTLEFTGERFTPESVREIRYEHLHRYALAREWVSGLDVLDAACGEGYGAALLAERAATVTGVDISEAAIGHARDRYRAPNLSFERADCCSLPFEDDRFGAIVSFETLEHLERQHDLLTEFRRVLKDDGFLVISSPDRAIYTDRLGNQNPYHVRELYRDELETLLTGHFPAMRLLGQRLAFHSLIWPADGSPVSRAGFHREQDATVRPLGSPGGDAVYLIALCAARPQCLPSLQADLWLFDDDEESVYRHYQHEIRKNMQAGTILAERDREIAELKSERAGTDAAPWWRRLLGRS